MTLQLSVGARQRLLDAAVTRLFRWHLRRAQLKRNWNPDDFAWAAVRRDHPDGLLRVAQGYFAVEQYAPDYAAEMVARTRDRYGAAQFYLHWGYEESRHSDLWRAVLVHTGYRSEDWVEDYARMLRAQAWRPPFDNYPEQLIYTVLQERATQLTYLRFAAQVGHDPVLARAVRAVAGDEAAHFAFFLAAARLHLHYFPTETLEALATVLAGFRMPASDLIPDYDAFVTELYAAGLFGRAAYAHQVVRHVLAQLGVRAPRRGAVLTAAVLDQDYLAAALARLLARLDEAG